MTAWETEALFQKSQCLSPYPLTNPTKRERTLHLPDVTLVCADCVAVGRAAAAMERCLELASFGAVKLLTSLTTDYPYKVEIQHLPDLVSYSVFALKRLHEYISTKHMLIVQHDGIILNPECWEAGWLEYDYVAPLFDQWSLVGSGGFSLRSKRLMAQVSAYLPDWDGSRASTDELQHYLGCYEDGAICILMRQRLEAAGFKFAPIRDAVKFAQGGGTITQYHLPRPFGFHRPDPRRTINYDTGEIKPL